MSFSESFPSIPKAKVDRNMTGLAGEFFVAAELLKRGLQVSVTFGNAKQIDLFAHNPKTGRNFSIQVKALRIKNYFPIREVTNAHVYIFVILNPPGKPVQYFIAHGKELLADPVKYAYEDEKFSAIHANVLTDFENKWSTFDNVTI